MEASLLVGILVGTLTEQLVAFAGTPAHDRQPRQGPGQPTRFRSASALEGLGGESMRGVGATGSGSLAQSGVVDVVAGCGAGVG